ncbi:MAG TPA: YcxB family protein [Terriglobales bacterium]|jgi:hypothetical protein
MQFDYEIPAEEFAAAQLLYYKGYAKGKHIKRAMGWLLTGVFLVSVAIAQWTADWTPILLLLTGVWFLYVGISILHPRLHFRRYYPVSGLAGRTYHADLDQDGMSVSGDGCSWQVRWTDVLVKGEDNRVFMFTGKGTIFIFGKKYLTDEQQHKFASLRRCRDESASLSRSSNLNSTKTHAEQHKPATCPYFLAIERQRDFNSRYSNFLSQLAQTQTSHVSM